MSIESDKRTTDKCICVLACCAVILFFCAFAQIGLVIWKVYGK